VDHNRVMPLLESAALDELRAESVEILCKSAVSVARICLTSVGIKVN